MHGANTNTYIYASICIYLYIYICVPLGSCMYIVRMYIASPCKHKKDCSTSHICPSTSKSSNHCFYFVVRGQTQTAKKHYCLDAALALQQRRALSRFRITGSLHSMFVFCTGLPRRSMCAFTSRLGTDEANTRK